MNKYVTLVLIGAVFVGQEMFGCDIPSPDKPQQPVVMISDDAVQSPGVMPAKHHDVGMAVYLLGETDDIEFRHGTIEEVYDNGYYKIGVHSASYYDGSTIRLFKSNYLIIHRTTALEKGGFALLK